MKLPSFARLPKYKKFTYEPRYFNPEEEERKERYAKIASRVKGETDPDKIADRISQAFRNHKKHQNKNILSFSLSTVAMRLIIMGILGLGGYLYLEHGDKLNNLIDNESPITTIFIGLVIMVLYVFLKMTRK